MMNTETMTTLELMALRNEYERMLSIARERNQIWQEFKLQEFIEKLDEQIDEQEGVQN